MAVDELNFVKLALENGGSIHPLILPHEELKGPALTNPSIYLDGDKLLVNLRNINYTLYHSEKRKFEHPWGPLVYIHPENDWRLRTWNYLCEMDDNMRIKSYHRIDTSSFPDKELWDFVGLEDCRIVRWNNKLYMTGVRRDLDTIGTGRMELSEIEFTENGVKEVSQHRIPAPPPDQEYCNKNWMPILDMPYHYVKWTNGTEIVRYNIDTNTTETVLRRDWKDFGTTDLRGGSQIIPLGDNYRFCLTHETYLTQSAAGRKDGVYRHRFIVWDKEWNIVKVSRQFSFMNAEIEFAVGMVEYKGNYLITFGYQDNAAYLVKVSKEFVLDFIGIENTSESQPESFPPFTGYPTESLEGHIYYTNEEWTSRPFYVNIIEFLKERQIKSVLDVGGCTGEVPKIMFDKISSLETALILEPVSVNFNFIQDRFKNEYRIKVINKALYYGADFISLGQSDGNVGGYNMHSDNHNVQFNDIPTTTLENLPKYDFLKIDIEGAERNILENASCFVDFKYIAIEFHDEMGSTWPELVEKYIPTHKIAVDGRLYGNPESVLLELK
jgi:FkbM family methyltransferase